MSIDTQSHPDYRFVLGLLTGTIVGAGLMMLYAPVSGAHLRQRIGGAVDDIAQRGRYVRRSVADVVAQGAHEVEQFAAHHARAVARQL